MNASIYPISSRLESYGLPPVLIAASSEAAARRAAETADGAELPFVSIPLDAMLSRLDLQGSATAIWLELEDDGGPELDRILDRIDAEAGAGRYPAVIAAPQSLVDPIVARIRNSDIEVVLDGTPADRAAALALARWRRSHRNRGVAEDITQEPSAARLRQLSDEVSRIAASLARLSVGPDAPAEKLHAPKGEAPSVSLDTVRQVIRSRRLRTRFFDEELFADPAWDMLLDLLQAEIAQHRVPVSSLCIAAAVPATTALRWIKTMTDAGLFKRRADPHDGRRVFVELSPGASDAMHRYFGEVGKAVAV
ncbi:MarR family winged helix-turn-helix transcriptional regulator [Sphingomonas sp.]|uniref:MarR family winged helix-turn-helix transcriptional regulator n=1 Tax=Sphingomonas sp. TaxID=28214 RepID=UPI0025CD7E2C|nr:MarR family winged helix-turn-helix transcriptional regulator [Sphingomonas sp.]